MNNTNTNTTTSLLNCILAWWLDTGCDQSSTSRCSPQYQDHLMSGAAPRHDNDAAQVKMKFVNNIWLLQKTPVVAAATDNHNDNDNDNDQKQRRLLLPLLANWCYYCNYWCSSSSSSSSATSTDTATDLIKRLRRWTCLPLDLTLTLTSSHRPPTKMKMENHFKQSLMQHRLDFSC